MFTENQLPRHADTDCGVDAFVDEVVASAMTDVGSNRARVQRDALRYGTEYVRWALGRDEEMTTGLFEPTAVETYRAHLLDSGMPTGSANSRSSYLKRLHPDVGLAGTTRRRQTPKAPQMAPIAAPRHQLGMPAGLVDQLGGLQPRSCPPDLWERVSPVVIPGVASVRTDRLSRARDLVRSATLLAAWVHSCDRPVRLELVFDSSTVGAFADQFKASANRSSLTTHLSNLRAIQTGLGMPPAAWLTWERQAGRGGRNPSVVYDDDRLDDLFAEIAAVRSAHRRRHLRAVVVLTFGAGYLPKELPWATVDHLVQVDRGIAAVIHTPSRWDLSPTDVIAHAVYTTTAGDDRSAGGGEGLSVRATVPFLPGWQEQAHQVRDDAMAAGEVLLIGGSGQRRRARVNDLIRPTGTNAGISLDLEGARQRWLADLLDEPLDGLLAAIGVPVLHLARIFGNRR